MSKITSLICAFKGRFVKLSVYILGFLAIFWFIIRVIPKPSRASYPCQRAAFPLASAFIIWIMGTYFSQSIYKKAKLFYGMGNHLKASVFVLIALVIFMVSLLFMPLKDTVYGAINFATISHQGEILYANELASNTESIIEAKATVAIIKSEKATAAEITFTDVNAMIRQAVEMAGGFDTLIHEGDLVVIKPNVIAGRAQGASFSNAFPPEANGIATDYRVIQVVVNMVREKNATGKIVLIEGSGYGLTRKNIEAIGYNNITGLDSIICLEENITKWYDTSSETLQQVSLPEGKNLYSTANKYYLNKVYFNADVLISLPCLKSHFLTGITGGIKNVGIGATPVEMYGNGKGVAEDDLPGRWNRIQHGDFATQTIPLDKWIHDFYLCNPVDYVIMDGLQGAQYGPYPGSNTSHSLSSVQKNMRVILAGKDPLALDAIEALIEGFDPYLVGHLVLLANDDAGCINSSYIKVRGTQVHDIKTPFKEDNPGIKCKYTDFTGPIDATLSSCTIENGEINIALIHSGDLVKVEVAYADTILDPIVINDFSSITMPYAGSESDANKITVLLYDKYLNCTKLSLANPVSIVQAGMKTLGLYPVPATHEVNFELPDDIISGGILEIYSADGKMVFNKKIQNSKNQKLDISSLIPGNYILRLRAQKLVYQAAFNKI